MCRKRIEQCVQDLNGFLLLRITVPDAAIDSYMIAWKTDNFGGAGQRGSLSGAATVLPAGIFVDDIEGCFVEVVVPYPDMYFAGQIAMVQRNTCSFDDKAIRAQEAGAEAIMVYNRDTEPPTALVYMGGDADTILIDCWFTSSRQGEAIRAEIDLEERDVFIELSDIKASDANWTKDGAAYTDGSQSADGICSDGPGQYRITDFTADIGCGPIVLASDSVNQLVGPAPCGGQARCDVGIADDILNEKVSVYPNPTTGLINLSIGERVETEISVYTITGQKVINENTYNAETISIDLSKLDSGIYLVKIKQGDAIATKRVNVLK